MAVINVDDIYILGETGAQVDKVTGLFTKDEETTSGEKAFAQLNIGTAGSNRNLLDNPFFTVNQRSFTTGTNGSYFADRWKLSNTDLITATRNSDGTITFTKTSGSASTFIQHYIDRQTGLDEEATYTASLMDGDGNVYSVTEKFVPGTQSEKPVFINGLRVAIGLYGKGGQIWMGLYLQPASSGTFTLKAAKLEHGSVSTLANDAPPDYGPELLKCMRYFQRVKVPATMSVGFGTMTSDTEARVTIPLPVPLRSAPTVSINSIGDFRLIQNGAKTPSAFSYVSYSYIGVALRFVVSTGFTVTGNVSVQINSTSAYIDLSADL